MFKLTTDNEEWCQDEIMRKKEEMPFPLVECNRELNIEAGVGVTEEELNPGIQIRRELILLIVPKSTISA